MAISGGSAVAHANRLVGSLAKVGIRPAIDGRRKGVRESLENQTMGMAQSVAKLISAEIRHTNGAPVECVLADSCIGGVAEAAETAEKFARSGVGVSLTVSPCWCYGSETMDMDPLVPKAVWGFNGTERPGAVYLAAVLAGHTQKGLPAFGIYGRDVQDAGDAEIPADVREKILRFVRAGLAAAAMRGKSYLSLGNVSMGIAGSLVNHDFFERWLGIRVETVDMVEIVRRVERKVYDEEEFARALDWTKAHCKEGKDYNRAESAVFGRGKRAGVAMVDQDGDDRPRPDGRQPSLGPIGLRRRGIGPQRAGGRIPRAAAMDRSPAQRRFHGGDSQLVVRLERHPSAAGLRHGKRQPQRRVDALRPLIDQHGPGVRQRPHLLESGGGQARDRLCSWAASRPAA